MENLTKPRALAGAFAYNGEKNILPDNATGTEYASIEQGFPQITMIPLENGGEAPHGMDFNGLGNLTTQFNFYAQNGGVFTFNQEVSDKIGGYPLNAILWYFDEENVAKCLRSTKPNNTDNFVTNPEVIGTSWVEDSTESTTGNIGDIKLTCRTDVPFGGVWANGEEYNSTEYPQVWDMLQKGNLPALTYAAYADQIAEHSACGAFGVDTDNNKFKVPTINNVYLKAGNSGNIGQFSAESLPNIKAQWNFQPNASSSVPTATGAGTMSETAYGYAHGQNTQGNYFNWIGFDASKASTAYQDDAQVNPNNITYRAYVVLYSTVKEFSIADYTAQLEEKTEDGLQALANASDAIRDTQISNAILTIPQDFTLELQSGKLTLKSGSKLYIPNGSNVFDTYTVPTDVISVTTITDTNVDRIVAYDKTTNKLLFLSQHESGTSGFDGTGNCLYFNTLQNKIIFYQNAIAQDDVVSFPIGIVTSDGTYVAGKLKETFNGLGHIGLTSYVLPNIKVVIPNGLNFDGTCNNLIASTTRVNVYNFSGVTTQYLMINSDGDLEATGAFEEGPDLPNTYSEGDFYLCTNNTVYKNSSASNPIWTAVKRTPIVVAGVITSTPKKISRFSPKTTFKAIDYNSYKDLSGLDSNIDYVVESYQNGTEWYRRWRSGFLEQGNTSIWSSVSGAWATVSLIVPFATKSYNLLFTQTSQGATSTQYFGSFKAADRTETEFKYNCGQNEKPEFNWYACGRGTQNG